jgi:hypothetical protein
MMHTMPPFHAQILHRYSFMPGRASPMQRLAAHMRLELPCVMAAPGLEGQLSRFNVVLRAHFALLDAPSQSLRKPFNPVLGEVSRALQHGGPYAAPITAVCEQVSHHPPKTAFACYDPELRWDYIGWTDISPRFQGTYIRVPFTGHRALTLHGAGEGEHVECYTATIPGMEWHLFPAVRAMYFGTWHLWCPHSGLAAEIIHPAARFMSGFTGQRRTRVHGRVTQVNAGSDPLDGLSDSSRVRRAAGARTVLQFDGDFDGQITATESSSERSTVIWDVEREKGLEARVPATQLTPQLEPRSSTAVWGEVFAALQDKNWDTAARGKVAVEVAERRARKAREKQGVAWQSRWFAPSTRGDGWVPKP